MVILGGWVFLLSEVPLYSSSPRGPAWKRGCAEPSDSKIKTFAGRFQGNVYPFSKIHAMRWVETATGQVLGQIED